MKNQTIIDDKEFDSVEGTQIAHPCCSLAVEENDGECIAQCPRDNCYGGCVLAANHFGKHKCGVCHNTWE